MEMNGPSFVPARGVSNPHAQTFIGCVLRGRTPPETVETCLETPDGDQLEVLQIEPTFKGAPWVILLHGLEGSARAPYNIRMMHACMQQGWGVIAPSWRSCGTIDHRHPWTYHASWTHDITTILAHHEKSYPGSQVALVGFSLGASILIHALAQRHWEGLEVCCAAAISAPWKLELAAECILRAMGGMYARGFLSTIKPKLRKIAHNHPWALSIKEVESIQTLKDVERIYTVPVHGFTDVDAYYTASDPMEALTMLQTPLLVIHSMDDPIAGGNGIDFDRIEAHPEVALSLHECGGHVGFIARNQKNWLSNQIVTWIEKHLSNDEVSEKLQPIGLSQ